MNKYQEALDDLSYPDSSSPCYGCKCGESDCGDCNIKRDILTLKELVDKETAEKPFYDALETDDGDEIEVRVCPNCCETLSFINNFPYCPFCGKKLNWEE